MTSATTGGDNTALGECALKTLTTGTENVAIGRRAGEAMTSGATNTTIGKSSGSNITSGSNNTTLGNNSGADALRSITSGDNEIVIGNNSSGSAFIKIDWTVTSDLRDKTEIESVPHGLNFVNQITPIKYKFKTSREDETPIGKSKFGFKAQEILTLEGDNPIIINNDDEDNLKLTSAYLIPVLVNAIKELKAEIELLKNK